MPGALLHEVTNRLIKRLISRSEIVATPKTAHGRPTQRPQPPPAERRIDFGQVEVAVLISRTAGNRRGTARFASGEEALVDRLPPSASEGGPIRLEVTRPPLGEHGLRVRTTGGVSFAWFA